MKLPITIALCFTFFTLVAQNNVMTKNPYSIEIIRYTIPEAERQLFQTSYTKASEFLKASSYCKGFEMIHGTDEPQHYIIRIHWTSVEDHLEKFRNSAEFKSFFSLVRPFYNYIEEMKHYEQLVGTP